MGFDFRYPNITGATEREQLAQIKSYLHQFVDQLQWAMNNIESPQVTVVNTPSSSAAPSASARSAADPQVLFAEIKPLIIKSADIVEAYYEEISEKLEGLYVAESDFGKYKEATSQTIEKSSTDISMAFTNIQKIELNVQETRTGIGSNLESLSNEVGQLDTDLRDTKAGIDNNLQDLSAEVGQLDTDLKDAKTAIDTDIQGLREGVAALNYSLVEVNANIKPGLLYEDENGIPVYGLEIGQKNIIDGVEVFNKYARFTSGRLSFYDQNGTEVAYISDYKLYITHAEVTGSLKLGGYFVDTTNGLAFKWVGRG